jgi:hypothetical protein
MCLIWSCCLTGTYLAMLTIIMLWLSVGEGWRVREKAPNVDG